MFSIIIPVYNKAPYIEKAIQSVLTQSCQEFELIIVNDGSEDSSLEVIRNIDFSNHDVKVISQLNSGVSTARNNGAKVAKYDYLAFLDADDWWDPHFLKEMKNLKNLYPEAGIWGCGFYSVKNGKLRQINLGVPENFVMGRVNYAELLASGNCRPIWTGACIINANIFNSVTGFNPFLKFGEDFDLFFRIYLVAGLILLNKPLAYYNQDVDIKHRAISIKLYPKEQTVFFNLNYPESKTNQDVAHLVEFLQLRSLYPYYLEGIYKEELREIFRNIHWKDHQLTYFFRYKIVPVFMQKTWYKFKKIGSNIKQNMIQWKRKK